jgi:hypothetical protein
MSRLGDRTVSSQVLANSSFMSLSRVVTSAESGCWHTVDPASNLVKVTILTTNG